MKNCLVTKLKASVNNPDLPVLETMQQFTLDAITASGNSSMTDNQKWALNHFFYQIGVFDGEDTIFSKTKFMFLPMICSSAAKMLVNYKDNTAYSVASDMVLDEDGGIRAQDNSSHTATIATIGESMLNYTFAALSADAGEETLGFLVKKTSNNIRSGYKPSNSNRVSISIDAGDAAYSPIASGVNINAFIISARGYNDSNLSAYAVNGDVINKNCTTVEGRLLSVDDTDTLRINYSSNPLQAVLFGEALSSQDTLTLLEALVTLREAFVI